MKRSHPKRKRIQKPYITPEWLRNTERMYEKLSIKEVDSSQPVSTVRVEFSDGSIGYGIQVMGMDNVYKLDSNIATA